MGAEEQFGKLMLSVTGCDTPAGMLWEECLFNRIAAVACVICGIIVLSDLLKLLPSILDCLTMRRGQSTLEHNIPLARTRDMLFWMYLLPVSLVLDKYEAYPADFVASLPHGWSTCVILGVLLTFFMLRKIIFLLVCPRQIRGDDRQAAENTLKTYFLPMSLLLFVSVGIMDLSGARAESVKNVLFAEIAVIYLVSIFKTARIFGTSCNIFLTFLYLCAFEIAPAALLVVGAIVL